MTTDLVEPLSRAELALPPIGYGVEADRIAGFTCVRYDLDQPWATQAKVMHRPGPVDLAAAIDWLGQRAPRWTVTTRGAYAREPVFTGRGLSPFLELTCLALTEPDELAAVPSLPDLEIGPARDPEEFLVAYGGELAPLITPNVFAHPGYHHLVARLDGTVVACAQVRFLADTAYVSAVTVVPEYRGRGFGTAISAAAAGRGLTGDARVVWLTAVSELHPLYTRLGFRPVDVHVLLTSE